MKKSERNLRRRIIRIFETKRDVSKENFYT